jgi:hypothetical protein
MIGQYAAVITAIILALANAISVAQSQNETNKTGIGENQSVSGRIPGFGEDLDFGPRVVDEPPN